VLSLPVMMPQKAREPQSFHDPTAHHCEWKSLGTGGHDWSRALPYSPVPEGSYFPSAAKPQPNYLLSVFFASFAS